MNKKTQKNIVVTFLILFFFDLYLVAEYYSWIRTHRSCRIFKRNQRNWLILIIFCLLDIFKYIKRNIFIIKFKTQFTRKM